MKIEFSSDRYEYSHGKAPRGFGTWIFTYTSNDQEREFWHVGKLSEAKAACRKHISETEHETGTIRVTVAP